MDVLYCTYVVRYLSSGKTHHFSILSIVSSTCECSFHGHLSGFSFYPNTTKNYSNSVLNSYSLVIELNTSIHCNEHQLTLGMNKSVWPGRIYSKNTSLVGQIATRRYSVFPLRGYFNREYLYGFDLIFRVQCGGE